MAQVEQYNHRQTFELGINSDLARELMPHNKSRYNLNCLIRSSNHGNKGIVTNLMGNILIETPLPDGDNLTIGTAINIEDNQFIFFTWNSLKYHCWFLYDEISNTVTKLLENLTDTGGVDILRFDKDHLILGANIIDGKVYFVDGLNKPRKANISKLLDKSSAGYGNVILESYISAYKPTSIYAPTAVYVSDTEKKFNRFYGQLIKPSQRYWYADKELSCVSDWGAVVLPDNEPSQGINSIPTNNNGMDITVETGSRDVTKIEILIQSTNSDIDTVESILNWKSIVILDKKKLGIADNSTYTYRFYNDQNYPIVSATDVIQPQSFMMSRPKAQTIAKSALIYANGYVGWPVVDVDGSISIEYSDLFILPGTENEFNKPQFLYNRNDDDFVRGNNYITYYDGTDIFLRPSGAPSRFARHTLTIGSDVKKGNKFSISLGNGESADQFYFDYTATITDTAKSVAYNIKQFLIGTGRIYRKTPDIPDTNIFTDTIDLDGNVSFSYIIKANKHNNYINGSVSVTPVQFDSLKDTGQSIKNEKMGSVKKIYYEYIDEDGQKSAAYSSNALVVSIKSENEDGIKASKIILQTNHVPPKRARYFQILRSVDLNASDYIRVLVQKVVNVPTDNTSQYLDLVIGSFFTYKKLHPNTTLNYQFEKGDRISLKNKTSDGTYYPFFETEVIEYNDIVTDRVKSNVVTNGSNTVEVGEASADNIGKFISIQGSEREILGVASGSSYLLNNVIGGTDATTYLFYDLIDRRGTLRIRKPADITIEDNSMIEVYKPSRSVDNEKTCYEFQKKFPIINPGTDQAYHGGDIQDQSATQPSLIDISGGTTYVRNREFPISNAFPGTQVIIQLVEDPSYSDFYFSNINDNGRVNSEDQGQGEVHVGSRMQFSGNFVEGTAINGFNNFRNLDRKDYNDDHGHIMLIKYNSGRINVFKQLRSCFVTVDAILTKDNAGSSLLVASNQFLNDLMDYAWEGGVGNNPESYADNGTHRYYVSTNSGVIIRFGGNGEEPISETFSLDAEVRELLAEADKNGAKIFGEFDRELGYYKCFIQGSNKYIYFNGMNGFIVGVTEPPTGTVYEIVTPPSHGTFDFTTRVYTPNTDFIGHDTFSYRALINGAWQQPKNVCIDIVDDLNTQTAWRVKDSSYVCSVDEYGLRTGYIGWTTLEEYKVVDESLTGNEKPNVSTDANYVAPIYAPDRCVPEPQNTNVDPFSYTPITNAELSTEYLSDVLTLTGPNIPVEMSVVDGLISLNGGAFVAGPVTIRSGDTHQVKRTSSNLHVTEVHATVTIGNQSANFSITTRDLVTRYIWGRIFAENVTEVASGIFAADIFLRSYIGSSNTVPPGAVTGNLYNCTNSAIAVSYHQTGSPNNDFSRPMSNENEIRLSAPGTEFQIGYPKQYVSSPGVVYYYSFTGKAENEMVVLQTILI